MQQEDPNDPRLYGLMDHFFDSYRNELVARGSLKELMKTDEGRRTVAEINPLAAKLFEGQTQEEMDAEDLPYVIGLAVSQMILFALDQAKDSR